MIDSVIEFLDSIPAKNDIVPLTPTNVLISLGLFVLTVLGAWIFNKLSDR